jgi:DNA-directed RNA polymerase specialized sigma24 family protein
LLAIAGEMKPAEIARVCGVTPEALRQRLSRARAMLARELKLAGVRRRVPAPREVTV